MKEFIENPESIEDYFSNVEFQFDSVEGYLHYMNDLESTAVKIECLIRAAQKFLEKLNSLTI